MSTPTLLFGDSNTNDLSQSDLQELLDNISLLDPHEQSELLQIAATLDERESARACREDLIEFCKSMDNNYIVGAHHKHLGNLLMEVEMGTKDRITVSVAPRHGKSRLTSEFYTAWYLGRNPTKQVMLVSHTADLAVDFGRKVRNLIATPEYQKIFPGVSLATDSKSAGRWNTNQGGIFYATGVGSSLAGRGADLLIIDDPVSEQDMLAGNFDALEKAYEWYRIGARTRLMPGGRVAVVATRWARGDLIGRLIRDMTLNPEADQFEVVEFPAILNEHTDNEKALWPEFFDLEALRRTRATMPAYQWNAQYQQNPTGETSAILKREWWKRWEKDEPPKCSYIIMTLDAAAETGNRADFTAMTVWGVWFNEEQDNNHLILLNAVQERMEFPELKTEALKWYKQWEPDSFIVEKKSNGVPLYQELRRIGVPVSEFTPHRGTGDKIARLNAVADIVKSGLVWVPQTRWADAVVEEAAEFPSGEHDDLCLTANSEVMLGDGRYARIDSIQVGDSVMTLAGPKLVLVAGFTGAREVYTIRFGSRVLELTGNHPILTPSGWVSACKIKPGSVIITLSTLTLGVICSILLGKLKSRLFDSTGETTEGTRILSVRNTGVTSVGQRGFYTEMSGRSIMVLFLRVLMSTIKMGTHSTMTSVIWKFYQKATTTKNTWRIWLGGTTLTSAESTLATFALPLQNGTAPRKDWRGTENTQKTVLRWLTRTGGKGYQWLLNIADFVGWSSPVKTAGKSTVPTNAPCGFTRRKSEKRALPHPSESAGTVRGTTSVNTSINCIALRCVKVGTIERTKVEAVYNLSVADEHNFVANSVVVHNCDCLSMALARFRQGGFITLPSDEAEEQQYFKSRRGGYY